MRADSGKVSASLSASRSESLKNDMPKYFLRHERQDLGNHFGEERLW